MDLEMFLMECSLSSIEIYVHGPRGSVALHAPYAKADGVDARCYTRR
jgi:hypothetical protein